MLTYRKIVLTVHAPYHTLIKFLSKAPPAHETHPTTLTPPPPTTLLPAI